MQHEAPVALSRERLDFLLIVCCAECRRYQRLGLAACEDG